MATNEQQQATQSYLQSFIIEVELMTNFWATYNGNLIQLNDKTNKTATNKDKKIELTEQEKQDYKNVIANLRFYTGKVYMKFKGLKKNFKEFQDREKEVDDLFDKFNNTETSEFAPESKSTKEYCLIFHELIAAGIIQNALKKVSDIYATENK